MVISEFPRFDRVPFRPNAATVVAGVSLSQREVSHGLTIRPMPAVSFADLFQIDVAVADVQLADVAPFAIDLDRIEADLTIGNLRRETIAGVRPMKLADLRSITSVKADAVAGSRMIENRARVAIVHREDAPGNQTMLAFAFTNAIPVV
jgi:hypothetical protein